LQAGPKEITKTAQTLSELGIIMSKYFLKNKESGEIAATKKKGGWTFFSFWRAVPDSGKMTK
jgi:hypothetical protein